MPFVHFTDQNSCSWTLQGISSLSYYTFWLGLQYQGICVCISIVYPNSNQGQNILKANCLSKTFHMRVLLSQKIFWVNKIKFYNSIFYCFSVLVVLASCPWLNWKTPWLKSKKCSKREATLLNISHHPSLPIIEKRKNNVKLESYYYFSYSLRLDLSLNLFCTFWYIVLTYWKILTRTFFYCSSMMDKLTTNLITYLTKNWWIKMTTKWIVIL